MNRLHRTRMAEFVMVVDDDLTSAKVPAKILESAGYETAIAGDGFDALLNISERQPDLMFTDLQMPRMSGFELLSVVRRRFPEIPVITTSGAFEPALIPPCVICDAFLRKGAYQPPELLAKVDELLNGQHRPAHIKRDEPVVWLPRGRDDYYIVTCRNCLRSFPVRSTTEDEHSKHHTPCIHCQTALTYFIEGRRTA